MYLSFGLFGVLYKIPNIKETKENLVVVMIIKLVVVWEGLSQSTTLSRCLFKVWSKKVACGDALRGPSLSTKPADPCPLARKSAIPN